LAFAGKNLKITKSQQPEPTFDKVQQLNYNIRAFAFQVTPCQPKLTTCNDGNAQNGDLKAEIVINQ
jgi:hypothetical protein